MPGEDVTVRDAVLLKRVQQGTRHVVLAGHVGKALRTIFPGQNLITHAIDAPWVVRSGNSLKGFYRSGAAVWRAEKGS